MTCNSSSSLVLRNAFRNDWERVRHSFLLNVLRRIVLSEQVRVDFKDETDQETLCILEFQLGR